MTHQLRLDATRYLSPEGRECTPHPRQAIAMEALRATSVDEVYVFGGFGSGKTLLLCWAMIQVIAENLAHSAGADYLLVSSTDTQLKGITWLTFQRVFCQQTGWDGGFETHPWLLHQDKQHDKYTFQGFSIQLSTGHNGCQNVEGGSYTAVFTDESVLYLPEAQPRLRARRRQSGVKLDGSPFGWPVFGLFNCATPQIGRSLPWLRDRYKGAPIGQRHGTRYRMALHTEDNLDNLPANYMDVLLDAYSEAMSGAVLKGELDIILGRTVPGYNDGHVMHWDWDPDKPVVLWWDPGYHRPMVIATQQYGNDNREWVAFDQVVMADVDVAVLGNEVGRRPWVKGVTTIVHDPAAVQKSDKAPGGISSLQILNSVLKVYGASPGFVHPTGQDKIVAVGLERLRSWVLTAGGKRYLRVGHLLVEAEEKLGLDVNGKPIIGLHRALKEQPINPLTGEPDRRKDWDFWSHAIDCARYAAVLYNSVMTRGDQSWYQAAVAPVADVGTGAGGAMGDGVGGGAGGGLSDLGDWGPVDNWHDIDG